jgi:putative RecB family exonuclease
VARKPSLSPTKITAFLACPLKYRWTYVDPRGKWYLRAKPYYSFGATMHKVLQRFHDSGDAGVQTVEQAVQAVSSEWVGAGYPTPEEAEQARADGQAVVQAYVESALRAPPEGRVLFLERILRLDLGPFALLGRVDRVDEMPDGSIEIIDYKSGRLEVESEDVREDIAMCCYQLLVCGMFPEREVRARIVALRSGRSAAYAMSRDELQEFRADLVSLGVQILRVDWTEVSPVAKPICPDCDFLPLCKSDERFAQEVARLGR